jgi:hypothetical protein
MNQITQYCGSPGLPGYDMNPYVAGTWGHEGRGYNGGVGHQTLGEEAAGQPYNDPYAAIEELVFPNEAGLVEAVNILVVPIADYIHQFQADANTINGGPHGNWTPTPGRYIYFWELQPGGTSSRWTPYVLTKGN